MKVKSFLMWGLLGSLFACNPVSNPSYTLVGTVDSTYNGKTVYLTDYDDKSFGDSAIVVDGTFTLKGRKDTAAYCRLKLGSESANLVLENGYIQLQKLENRWVAQGSPLNDAYNVYKAEYSRLQKELRGKQKEIGANKDFTDEERAAAYKTVWGEYKPLLVDLSTNFLSQHKNNVLVVNVAQKLWGLLPPQELLDSVKHFAGFVREKARMKEFETCLEAWINTQPGNMFVDMVTTDSSGKESKLSDYVGKGKYVLVDFWASWCGPCRGEIPNLAKIHNKYAKNGKMVVLGVAAWDEEASTRKAMEELNITWPQILNAGNLPMTRYGILGIPHIILFGPDGKIVKRELRGQGMVDEIDELMK